mmetsp:Transcript_38980/g.90025  ORF Transcript_38980/g.90025 Transcript_38980/m.90025 type:complete len:101 (-) Transcript_38980:261-563(-)
METLQQSISTTDTDLQGMSSRMAAMQQSMSTIQGPNPPAWFVRLISVNTADIKQSYEVPLWIRGADIIQNNLTTFTRYGIPGPRQQWKWMVPNHSSDCPL